MGSKTLRRLAVAAVVLVLGVVSIVLLQRYQVRRMGKSNLVKAEEAVKAGDLTKAEELYLQHVLVFPKDAQAQLAYAKVLLERSRTPARMGQAIRIYRDVLGAQPGSDDVRRDLVELMVESEAKGRDLQEALINVNLLAKRSPDDADLAYLQARCQQASEDDKAAAASYTRAIAGKAEQRFDAVQRLAALYRGPLATPEEADKVVDKMVEQEPGDFRVYLERGRYRARNRAAGGDLAPIEADFKEAVKLAPGEAEPYIELAQAAMQHTPPDPAGAAKYIEQGLAANPKGGRLHLVKAALRFRDEDNDGGLKALRAGLEILPDDVILRLTLADALAQRGATVELRDQVQELARLGMGLFVEYYTAYAYVNARDWTNAKKILLEKLTPLDLSGNTQMRANISNLLARCYAALGDSDRQRTALASAVRDDPTNARAKFAWIADLAAQGDVERAISEYRRIAGGFAAARLPLAQLLIDRTRRLAPSQRDWKEVEQLIDQIEKDDPSSSQPAALRAQVLTARGQRDGALAVLEAARSKAPRDRSAVLIWTSIADLKAQKQDYPGALQAIDDARAALGDSGDLRLARVRLLSARGGPELAASLVESARDLDALPLDQRIAVLNMVGDELQRTGHRAEAAATWARYAEVAPQDLRPRLQILSNALAADENAAEAAPGSREAIEKALADVRQAEGPDGFMSRYGQVEYLLWQARHAADASAKSKIRAEARSLLTEIRARRPDWSVVPLTSARLEEQELAEVKDGPDKERRLDRVADLYRQAVEMGQRNLATVRHATEVLMNANRISEVAQLWAKVPALNADSDVSLVERSILDSVVKKQDYKSAEEIVRQRVAARPDDLSERIFLAQLLLMQKRPDEAEAELKSAVAADPSDANRRIVLVQFLVSTGQVDKAEQAVSLVEKAVGPEKAPLAMAACSDLIAMAGQATAKEALRAKWTASAMAWYARAQAAKPGEFSTRRAYIEFLLRTNQVDEVEKELAAILNPPKAPAEPFNPADVAWAKRTLALTYVARSELTHDYQQAMKARNLFAPTDRDGGKLPEEGEDLRVLARVYEAQKFIPYRIKAIEVLEKLVKERRANDDDTFLLARLYQADDRWDDAHKLFAELMSEKGKPATSGQDINQQVIRLTYYASALISRVQAESGSAAGQADAVEAQELIDRLKKIQPDGFNGLAFQARLDKATGKADQAVARIKELADRPQLAPALARATGGLAETLDLLDVAEAIFKRNASSSGKLEDQLEYAAFLGRRGRMKEALDVCEPLWKSTPNPEPIAPTVISILLASKAAKDEAQIARVSGWIEASLQQKPDSTLLAIALGTLRDREGRYADAVKLYGEAVKKGNAEAVIPLNNLAWLLTLQGEKGAAPLEMINRAIALRGPIPEFLDTRAIVYLTNGESKRAIEDLENAVAIDPSASRYFHLARAYLEAGDLDAAKKSFVRARDKGLDEGDVHPLEKAALNQVESALK